MSPRPEDEEEEQELLEGEASVWGYEEEPPPPEEDHPPTPAGHRERHRPHHSDRLECPVQESLTHHCGMWRYAHQPWYASAAESARLNHRRVGTPEPRSHIKYTPQPSRMPMQSQPTPMSGVHHTPRVIGPSRCTFQTPEPPSPLTPSARINLLRSLNLVEMEGGGGRKGTVGQLDGGLRH